MTVRPADLDRLEQLAREATPEAWDQWDWASWREVTSDRWSLDAFQLRPNVALTIALSPAVVSELVAAARLGAAWEEAEGALPEGWAVQMLWGTITEDRWAAAAGPFPAVAGDPNVFAGGPTPAAALTALAEALRGRGT